MSRTPTQTQSFEEGVRARTAGMKPADNPYDLHTPEHDEWQAGLLALYDLDEDSDPVSDRDQPADDPGDPAITAR
jgi:hypothetical protein